MALNKSALVLGGMVLAEETDSRLNNIAYKILSADDFVDPMEREIFKTFISLVKKDECATWQTLFSENENLANLITPTEFVGSYLDSAPMTQATKIMIPKFKMERLNKNLSDFFEQQSKGGEVTKKIELTLTKIQEIQTLIDELKEEPVDIVSVDRRVQATKEPIRFSTSWDKLDEWTGGGMGAGEFWVVGAYTNIGKTTFACQLINSACSDGAKVRFYSLEMTEREILNKLRWVAKHTNQKNVLDYDLEIITTKDDLSQIWLDMGSRSVPNIIVVDYLQLLHKNPRESDYEALTRASVSMQREAIKKNICCIGLSQISNEGAKATDDAVISLKGSGGIASSADKVILLQRKQEDLDEQPAKIILRKNRQGRRGTIDCVFDQTIGLYKKDTQPGFQPKNI